MPPKQAATSLRDASVGTSTGEIDKAFSIKVMEDYHKGKKKI